MRHFLQHLFGSQNLSSSARRLGYVKDQMGIQNRYVREQKQWQSHLDNCKHYIVETAKTLTKHHSVAVLGSGWLLDVPVDELSKIFDKVYLFDIVHPEQIIVRTRKYSNVHLETIDLTGGAIQVAENSRSYDEFLKQIQNLSLTQNFSDFDLVISLNILNQLDIILCDYLTRTFSVPSNDLVVVRQRIQQFHIDSLPRGKTCLITDYCEENTDVQTGELISKSLIYCTLPQLIDKQEWNWIFDTNQLYHEGQKTVMKVMAGKW